MRKFAKIVAFLLFFVSCGTDLMPTPTKQPLPDEGKKLNGIPDVFVIQDIPIYNPLDDYDEQYRQDCLKQVFLRCPPYTEYWIAEAWIDVCDNYAIILIEL